MHTLTARKHRIRNANLDVVSEANHKQQPFCFCCSEDVRGTLQVVPKPTTLVELIHRSSMRDQVPASAGEHFEVLCFNCLMLMNQGEQCPHNPTRYEFGA